MSSKVESAKDQVAELVQGTPELTFANLQAFSDGCQKLSGDAEKLYKYATQFLSAARLFVTKNPMKAAHLAGVLKHVRKTADDCDAIHKIFDSGQKPPSLRTILEMLLSMKIVQDCNGEPPFTIEAAGKKFIVMGKTIPTVPDKKKNPEDRKIFMDYLRERGRSDLIYEDVQYKGVAEFLEHELAKITPEEYATGKRPWPKELNVFIEPAITMRDVKPT